jgi:hypothetical protein
MVLHTQQIKERLTAREQVTSHWVLGTECFGRPQVFSPALLHPASE